MGLYFGRLNNFQIVIKIGSSKIRKWLLLFLSLESALFNRMTFACYVYFASDNQLV